MNSLTAPAEVVSSRALEQAIRHMGYFASQPANRMATAYDADMDDPTQEWFI
jgi:hypothetical protein